MNRTLFFLILISFIPALSDGGEGKRYGFEKACLIIRKTVTNMSLESVTTDTLYIEGYGEREVRHSHEVRNIKMLKQSQESRSISIIDGGWMTSYDPDTRKGRRMKNPFAETVGKLSKGEQEEFAKGIAGAFEAKTDTLAPEEVGGKMCEVTVTTTGIQGLGTKTTTWIWKDFVLKSISSGMGTETTEEAIRVDEGTGIPAGWLNIPPDVVISGNNE